LDQRLHREQCTKNRYQQHERDEKSLGRVVEPEEL